MVVFSFVGEVVFVVVRLLFFFQSCLSTSCGYNRDLDPDMIVILIVIVIMVKISILIVIGPQLS